MRTKTSPPQKSLQVIVTDWLQRRWWHHQYRRAHAAAFRIATMGQENPAHPQAFLNVAKDNLYMAAREFRLLAENWHNGELTFIPKKRPTRKGGTVHSGTANHLAAQGKQNSSALSAPSVGDVEKKNLEGKEA